jgi:hypothetical protein
MRNARQAYSKGRVSSVDELFSDFPASQWSKGADPPSRMLRRGKSQHQDLRHLNAELAENAGEFLDFLIRGLSCVSWAIPSSRSSLQSADFSVPAFAQSFVATSRRRLVEGPFVKFSLGYLAKLSAVDNSEGSNLSCIH